MRDMDNVLPLATGYATRADVCRTFRQDMKSLYLLSLLLTAGEDSAEQCFESSLDDCMDVMPVFKEWTASWTRRVVLQNAIRMLRPAAHRNEDETPQSEVSSLAPELSPVLGAVLQLDTFERFVFIMSVLEGYSVHECSLLLRSSKRDVVDAKANALEHLGPTSGSNEFLFAEPHAEPQFAAMDIRKSTI